ncbi:MAG TPA: DUF1330 domain-containing protein, partial [Cyclobacteriaceae bacterium]|nr:DUF1330 domain-containing protein [Cyclobacteriaceae bacterium]
VNITDPVLYEEYRKLTPGSLAPFDGKFIVRGGKTETLEGAWNPGRVVVLEFPSIDKAKAWYNSEIYAPAKAIRRTASTGKMIIVQGV